MPPPANITEPPCPNIASRMPTLVEGMGSIKCPHHSFMNDQMPLATVSINGVVILLRVGHLQCAACEALDIRGSCGGICLRTKPCEDRNKVTTMTAMKYVLEERETAVRAAIAYCESRDPNDPVHYLVIWAIYMVYKGMLIAQLATVKKSDFKRVCKLTEQLNSIASENDRRRAAIAIKAAEMASARRRMASDWQNYVSAFEECKQLSDGGAVDQQRLNGLKKKLAALRAKLETRQVEWKSLVGPVPSRFKRA